MIHLFQKGSDAKAPVLLLLHGTGGNERDMLPLAPMIHPGSSVLSVRGNVLENGMPRFFKRLAEGVFDEQDLIFRTEELQVFLNQALPNTSLTGRISWRSATPMAPISPGACSSTMKTR